MDLWRHWPMRILAALCVVSAATLFATPHAAGQQTGLKDMVYVSPTWGYSIRWYTSEWTVADESSQAMTDVLTLQDALGNTISFTGTPGFEGDAEACLDDMVARVLATPGAADPETVEGGMFGPFEWRDPRQSYTLMQVRLPVNGALQDHAVYLECQTLVPGEAVFERLYTGPVAVFDQWYDDIVETLEGVFLPASAWLTPPEGGSDVPVLSAGAAPLADYERSASLVTDAAGDPQLLVGLVDGADDVRVVTFENIGDAAVTVQPANLVFTIGTLRGAESAGPVQQPNAVTWADSGTTSADGSRTLQPGERAEVQVAIAPLDTSTVACDDEPFVSFEYQPAEGPPVTIDTSAIETCLSQDISAPMGGGRPKLRLSR